MAFIDLGANDPSGFANPLKTSFDGINGFDVFEKRVDVHTLNMGLHSINVFNDVR